MKSIVSSNLADDIAKEYNLKLIEVLTGFKYIGEQIKWFEEQNSYEYMFGFEESCGYLKGTYARDKDAVVASMLVCELAAYCRLQGKSVLDAMNELYAAYGYYLAHVTSVELTGADAMEKAAKLDRPLIFAIGNAPTALIRVAELIDAGALSGDAKILHTGNRGLWTILGNTKLFIGDLSDKAQLEILVKNSSDTDVLGQFANATENYQLTEQDIADRLYTAGQPDPDLIVRTGGEMRLSNFLLWQASYSEYYSDPCYWPDFDEARLHAALDAYEKRVRKFGGNQ